MKWLEPLVQYAHHNLRGARELEALWERGASDEQIRDFRIGYLDKQLPVLQNAKEFLSWYAFNKPKLLDVFVFPLTNALGQVKGLQFRRVERRAKGYLDYFAVKDEPVLFGLNQAMPHVWKTQTICLVEGAFDYFPVQRVFPNTVATMTSSVSTSFHRFLRRNVQEVWFCYDMDFSGKKGVREFIKNYRFGFRKILHPQLPRLKTITGQAKDPGELWECLGDDQFRVLLKNAFKQ
jgi:DNA primase